MQGTIKTTVELWQTSVKATEEVKGENKHYKTTYST
jgi:hypothetical protein